MRVYLLKDLAGKGKKGEIIEVNDGYGKNFIIKNKIGIAADNALAAEVKAKKEADNFHTAQDKKAIAARIAELEKATVTLKAKVGDTGKMFGSVTGTEVSLALKDAGFDIDKRDIVITEPIKAVGTYKLKVKFPYAMSGNFTLEIVKE